MSSTLVTADPHLLHPLVTELRGFDTVEDYVEWYCEMWIQSVTKRDRVIIAGDTSAGNRERFRKVNAIIKKLPGRKLLTSGNHDEPHPQNPKAATVMREYMEVYDYVGTQYTLRLNGRFIDVSHFPRHPDKYDIRERGGVVGDIYGPYRVPDTGRWLLHGHTHHNDVLSGERQIHVGLDGWGRMVTEGDIMHIITEAEAGRMVPENRMGSDSILLARKR